jgi:hypothetical protein
MMIAWCYNVAVRAQAQVKLIRNDIIVYYFNGMDGVGIIIAATQCNHSTDSRKEAERNNCPNKSFIQILDHRYGGTHAHLIFSVGTRDNMETCLTSLELCVIEGSLAPKTQTESSGKHRSSILSTSGPQTNKKKVCLCYSLYVVMLFTSLPWTIILQ